MNKNSKIYIAGHRGLVGSAIIRCLKAAGYNNIIGRTHAELELTRQTEVEAFFERERPEYVFLAAARVGGIHANNTYPAEFIFSNLCIQVHIIDAAYKYGARKLLFLGSSCIYPKFAPQPMKEEYLLSGLLEPTNEPYAVAKIAGIKMCQAYNRQYGTDFISVMPTNLYGPNDNFDLNSSHVLPAMIRKFDDAKTDKVKVKAEAEVQTASFPQPQPKPGPAVVLWGTGAPYREFLHVDDLADACVFLMNNYDESEIVNIGTGEDLT
ncbi:MAG TPA: GDP-L-fucose synthase, partial [Dissulfurispiraceae bacterium]|nr:GDP-L-fucose synthase [Dissulfurispiraceae bacterium]